MKSYVKHNTLYDKIVTTAIDDCNFELRPSTWCASNWLTCYYNDDYNNSNMKKSIECAYFMHVGSIVCVVCLSFTYKT